MNRTAAASHLHGPVRGGGMMQATTAKGGHMTTPKVAVKGFAAGFLSVVTVMAAAWWVTRAAGLIPAAANPLWSMTPPVPPFGVPRVINLAFWGGVWGAALALLFRKLEGGAYWLAWFLAGAIAVAGTAIFIVPVIKGLPIRALTPRSLGVSAFLNGMWGLGAALWLTLLGREPGKERAS
jgi:hypothetical protein